MLRLRQRYRSSLDRIMKNRTSFIIAQRISTVLKANKIVVLDKGRMVAEGYSQRADEDEPDI